MQPDGDKCRTPVVIGPSMGDALHLLVEVECITVERGGVSAHVRWIVVDVDPHPDRVAEGA